MKRHLTDQELIDLRFDTLEADSQTALEKHLQRCAACRKRSEVLQATLGQLDDLRHDVQAPEALITTTLRRVEDVRTAASREQPAGTRISWGRLFWIGSFAAAAVLALIAWPRIGSRNSPLLSMANRTDTATLEPQPETASAPAMPVPEKKRERVGEDVPADLLKAKAGGESAKRAAIPQEPPAPAAPQVTKLLAAKPAPPPLAATTPMPAPRVARSTAAALEGRAAPTAAPAGAVAMAMSLPAADADQAVAEAPASSSLAVDVKVRLPSTSGTWLTGPQNAIRVRATRRDDEVLFLFVNQGSVLSANIRIVSSNGSNEIQRLLLPPLATTNLTIRMAK